VGQDAASQERPKFTLDESGDDAIGPLGLGQEGLEVVRDDSVENGVLGTARRVGGRIW